MAVFYFARGIGTISEPTSTTSATPSAEQSASTSATPVTEQVATVELEKGGIFEIKLNQATAPQAVANFTQKANSGFYDNLTFHRVEPGFVVQGGDPQGNGTGGQNDLPAEYQNVNFKTGSVGMASLAGRAPMVNDAQFFVTLSDDKLSAQDYVLFGQVIQGMDIVNQIKVGDKIRRIRVQ